MVSSTFLFQKDFVRSTYDLNLRFDIMAQFGQINNDFFIISVTCFEHKGF